MSFTIGIIILTLILGVLYYIAKANKIDKIDIRNKHIVITGGSSGIGWELCLEAFEQGFYIFIFLFDTDLLPGKKRNQGRTTF